LNNGEEITKKLGDRDGRLAKLLKECKDDSACIDSIFLASLNRHPRPRESKAIEESLKTGDKREEVFQDLFWAILNSKEFAFNH
jgi:hypothetical protein